MEKTEVSTRIAAFAAIVAGVIVMMTGFLFTYESEAAVKPKGVTVALYYTNMVRISCTEVKGASKYEFFVKDGSSKKAGFKRVARSKYAMVDYEKLKPGKKYTVKVRAIRSGKKTGFSKAVKFRTHTKKTLKKYKKTVKKEMKKSNKKYAARIKKQKAIIKDLKPKLKKKRNEYIATCDEYTGLAKEKKALYEKEYQKKKSGLTSFKKGEYETLIKCLEEISNSDIRSNEDFEDELILPDLWDYEDYIEFATEYEDPYVPVITYEQKQELYSAGSEIISKADEIAKLSKKLDSAKSELIEIDADKAEHDDWWEEYKIRYLPK